jgi:enoyl-CoA hydratase/carnithine racemase
MRIYNFVETKRDGEIAEIRLNNTTTNVLNIDVVNSLINAINDANSSCRAIIICGGKKFFSNGLDILWALGLNRSSLQEMFITLNKLVLLMLESPIPLVGVMKGHAIGAGKTILTACDYRISAGGRVLIGVPEVKLGVPNPYFADQLLRFLTNDSIASELIYSGELITGEMSASIGIVNEIGDTESVESRAMEKARALSEIPSLAFAYSKEQRTEVLCARIRERFPSKLEKLLDAWFGDAAQRLLHAAAERLRK